MLIRSLGRTVMKTTLAVLDKRDNDVKQKIMKALDSMEKAETERVEVGFPQSHTTEGLKKPKSRTAPSVAIGSILSNSDISIVDIENGKLAFQGRVYSP